MRILVTGANGYVGGRLVPHLLARGHALRCMVRDPARLQGRAWAAHVEVVTGDVLQPASLVPALADIDAAYYLVHSLGAGSAFHDHDVRAAAAFGQAAAAAGVKRIIYLGGLGDANDALSEHLRSRQDTGAALRAAGVPVTEFRAAVIVGSGSVSFEMIRYLAERVPVMICPNWVYTRIQPIAIRDVIAYLGDAIETPASEGQILEIGGSDVLTYGEMMMGYAKQRGLRRWLVPVPFLTPRLSSYWVHLVTPIPADIARPLIDGLRNEVIVRDPRARALFPDIAPVSYAEAVRRALVKLDGANVETAWSDALTSSRLAAEPVVLTTLEGMMLERRQRTVRATPERVFEVVSTLGGATGWLRLNWAWQLRGLVDRLVGGVGMRRGRRDPRELRIGDAVDFWRVEALEPGRLVRLRAEMKVPGRAWLEFRVKPEDDGVPGAATSAATGAAVVQTAYFAPKGLFGFLYWYSLYPIHGLIFGGMLREIARRAEAVVSPQ
ncbi:MAG TPA: SDR family oxidoreductase [Vicinamibacterales bacterium]|nr:SDR family oxidoreductase [Vicinamibacterales bacterium]